MAKSSIAICNISLSTLGERSIRSFDEDNQRARLCGNLYDFAVEFVLSQFDWPFARSYYDLREAMDSGFTFSDGRKTYQLPPDCLVARDVLPRGNKDSWEVIGNYAVMIPTSDAMQLRYTKRETNPSLFSGSFSMLVADFLTAKLSGPLKGGKVSESRALMEVFNFNLATLPVVDANVGSGERNPDDDPNADSFNLE
jgi:hypothetical protein